MRINMLTSLNNSKISMKIHIQFLCALPKIMQLVDVGKVVEIVSGLDVRINILTSLNNSEISLKIHMPYVTYACSLHVNANLSIFQLTFSQNFSQGADTCAQYMPLGQEASSPIATARLASSSYLFAFA